MCHRAVNFVRTVEHGDGARRPGRSEIGKHAGDPAGPAESIGHTQNFSPCGCKRWHTMDPGIRTVRGRWAGTRPLMTRGAVTTFRILLNGFLPF